VDGLLTAVAESVAGRAPVDEREARSQQWTLLELARLARPFDRDSDPTHVTGSAIVVGPRGVVLHLHKRLDLWLQPGGHLEPGETPWDAARREAQEETGLAVQWFRPLGVGEVPVLAHVDVHDGGRGHTHLDLRYVMSVEGDDEPAPTEGESKDVRWFSWPSALEVADPGLAGFLKAWMR
jgi:8-oxo-dGTP pyrophosphatase MutT (NUDIX family)